MERTKGHSGREGIRSVADVETKKQFFYFWAGASSLFLFSQACT